MQQDAENANKDKCCTGYFVSSFLPSRYSQKEVSLWRCFYIFNSNTGSKIEFEIHFYVEIGLFLQEASNYITFIFTCTVIIIFKHTNIMFLEASWLPYALIFFNNQVVVQTLLSKKNSVIEFGLQ
jgi:hypothetical protein